MSDTAADQTTTDERRGGLPEDDALAAAFSAATSRRRKRPAEDKPPAADPAGVPAADVNAEPADPPGELAPVVVAEAGPIPSQPTDTAPPGRSDDRPPAVVRPAEVAVRPEPREVASLPVADLGARRHGGPSEQRSTQCTVNVSASVRERFSAYQLAKKLDRGSEPTNAIVVRRAVLHARKGDLFAQMLEYVRHSQVPHDDEDDDPEGLFGDVQGRRAERGRAKDTRQLPFRPSYEELAVIDALATGYGFGNRSEFLDAALDAFLPPLPDKRRR